MVDPQIFSDQKTDFGLIQYEAEQSRMIVRTPSFDFDTFPILGETLLGLLSANAIEKQSDADLHSWLIDFEGCQLFLRAEHYSECVWFEAVASGDAREELDFLASLFLRGF
ncbi:DUF3630 family protein [Vibrio ostreicida]|uniref:DUF3630 family protein n=1 Tax=Vibrio ostreicida TaxID=526588 RepID=A0ABT8BPD0_9VIBR|nr:DUF3630 family protein [Vibrio ostreicida]MDN3608746.1 DUF3630 family protein [Vibrio ostreicida]NPD10574.1 DUF3630 family protein [Vibrio ostreicida]